MSKQPDEPTPDELAEFHEFSTKLLRALDAIRDVLLFAEPAEAIAMMRKIRSAQGWQGWTNDGEQVH